MGNVIYASVVGAKRTARTKALYQYDYGIILKIKGIDLPSVYEMHFSNDEKDGTALVTVGTEEGVVIPSSCLATGKTVYAWYVDHTGEDDAETIYKFTIPVIKRPKGENYDISEDNQNMIAEAISLLNNAVSQAEEYAQIAQDYSSGADTFSRDINLLNNAVLYGDYYFEMYNVTGDVYGISLDELPVKTYRVNVYIPTAQTEDIEIYWATEDSEVLNQIGTLTAGETEVTFISRPSARCKGLYMTNLQSTDIGGSVCHYISIGTELDEIKTAIRNLGGNI